MTVLKAQNISYGYYKSRIKALSGVSFTLEAGNFLAILGPNGSGKSTLMNVISGVLTPASGEVFLNGRNILRIDRKQIASTISFVPQNVSADFPFTSREVVLMGRFPYLSGFGIEKQPDIDAAEEAMKLTGVLHLKDRRINELSGGERQRVFIAQAIAARPSILMLDEPVSSLDIKYRLQILNLLRELNEKNGISVIVVLHDLNLALNYTKQVLLLKDGFQRAFGPPSEVISTEIIAEVFEVHTEMLTGSSGMSYIAAINTREASTGNVS